MKNIGNKITSMGESLKEFASKYLPSYRNSTTPAGSIQTPSEQEHREIYDTHEVNQSFMG